MKTIMLLSLLLSASLPIIAQESLEQEFTEEAPTSFVEAVLETCKIYAEEDEVSPEDLKHYLLECINEELEINEFKKLLELPKE